MARLQTSFVLGYHGCSADVGEAILRGVPMDGSERDYDWLGPGIYFWESDPVRAWEWAHWKVRRGDFTDPFVVGAAIDLGNCLDLMARDSLEILESAYQSFASLIQAAGDGRELPVNKKAGSADEDNLLRYLDCAVIRHLHSALEDQGQEGFDTVRGLFTEGGELFPGSGFKKKTHVQIAVRSNQCIKGFFRVEKP
jgi:hypothetical protein